MKSRDDVIAVESNTSALEVLNILENNRVSELVVLHEGQLVGLIEKQHFFDRIKNLGLGESQSTTDFLKGV
jgi:predicted transcriptional regulator